MPSQHSVAIVGGGFSGLLLALQLLRKGPPNLTAALIERAPGFGLGLAYSTQNPDHLLNVRVGNMSAFPDEPRHLIDWLARETGEHVDEAAFVSRETYGRYLRALLADAIRDPSSAARLILVPDAATQVARTAAGMTVTLAMGTEIEASVAVLAVGPMGPSAPCSGLEMLPAHAYAPDPWARNALDELAPDAPVLLLGSGLTMIDVALSLARRGHRGEIVAMSRRGLAPHSHATSWPAAPPIAAIPPLAPSRLVRWVRRRAAEAGWRATIDALRPHTQAFWQAASAAERSRLLRHLRPWWDIHRHRMAPPVAARIEAMRRSGQLSVVAGRLMGAEPVGAQSPGPESPGPESPGPQSPGPESPGPESLNADPLGDGVSVGWRPRGERSEARRVFQRVINCTGAGADLRGAALLRSLIERGEARVDALRLGLDVEPSGQVIIAGGEAHPSLYALGPITRGAFWESVAVPDIRNQAAELAARLVGALERRTLAA